MNERDDELLRRYRALPGEGPPAALDASILAASRRATRRPLARWAAPFSVAAVLVLALGLVLKVQRDAPEETLPSPPQSQAMPGTGAPAAGSSPMQPEKKKDVELPAAAQEPQVVQPPKVEKTQAPKVKRTTPFAPEPPARERPALPSTADLAPAEQPAAPAADALVRSNAAPPVAAPAPAPQQDTIGAPTAPVPPPGPARAQSSARMAAAPAAGATAKDAMTPEERELERIARLRAQGHDDEADAGLDAFRRAHPDYRIAPAMWEKVRRR